MLLTSSYGEDSVLKKSINIVFLNQFGISGVPETWITHFMFSFLVVFNILKLLLLFMRILQSCFAVKLQKYFVDYKTSPGMRLSR